MNVVKGLTKVHMGHIQVFDCFMPIVTFDIDFLAVSCRSYIGVAAVFAGVHIGCLCLMPAYRFGLVYTSVHFPSTSYFSLC